MDGMNEVHVLLVKNLGDDYFGVLGVYTSMEYAKEEKEKVLLSINNGSELNSGFNYTPEDTIEFNYTPEDTIEIVSVPIDLCAPLNTKDFLYVTRNI